MKIVLLALIGATLVVSSVSTTPQCPDVPPGAIGSCVVACAEGGCPTGQLCCSNGCGRTCQAAVVSATTTPLTVTAATSSSTSATATGATATLPTERPCPELSPGAIGACVVACDEGGCPIGQRCCSNGCGRTCQTVVTATTTPPLTETFPTATLATATLATATLPTEPSELQCPVVPTGTFGTCQVTCTETSCPNGQLCCSNGCGRTCQDGVPVATAATPTVSTPMTATVSTELQCAVLPPGTIGACVLECTDDSVCQNELLCCSNGCGRTCQPGVAVPTTTAPTDPCSAVTCDVPDCEDSEIIISSDPDACCPYCERPTLPPNACLYQGVIYEHDSSFPASDGCNTCFCSSGLVGCTEIGCPGARCLLPPVTGNCRGSFPSFFFNPDSGNCESFVYGGCGGNDNRFSTMQECRDACDTDDICLLPSQVGDCDAAFPSFYFNRDTERCEFFLYGGCGGNANRFPTLSACQERCDTGSITIPDINLAQTCPVVPDGAIGLCVEACDNCNSDQLCCSNGCGRVCTLSDVIPYYDTPLVCPDLDSDVFATCQQECNSDSDCSSGADLCCSNGCGTACVSGVSAIEKCSAIVDLFSAIETPLGAYVPQCRVDGSFAPVQFHEAASWCVDSQTGQPLSGYYPIGTQPNCTSCLYNGVRYVTGDSFDADDGCNTCFCSESGFVACTLAFCIDICDLPPDPGPCRAAIPAFHYDADTETCRQFIYGGCQGNPNKFSSVSDCLNRCNPESACLQRPGLSECEPGTFDIFYNTSSNMCEYSPFGQCLGIENNFNSGYECQEACNPDGPRNECLDIQCDIPLCTGGLVVTYDDLSCCPYCSPPTECRDDQYRCTDGLCVPSDWECDTVRDCALGEDEHAGCVYVAPCEYRCGMDDGVCIPNDYVCDGYPDCSNNRDESFCIDTDRPPENTQTVDAVLVCPASTDLVGTCDERCQDDSQCPGEGQLCCRNGCGSSCMEGLPASPLCPAIRGSASSPGLLGAFVPQCEADGSFSQIQCHGSTGYCWCVDVATGWPLTEGVPPTGGVPQCSSCEYNGQTYPVGYSFTHEDGCNTCHCTADGLVACTRVACAPADCEIEDYVVEHGQPLEDECSSCECNFGQLSCTRKECTPIPIDDINLTMPFKDNKGQIAARLRKDSDEDFEMSDEFKREIIRTFLQRYRDSLNLDQAQLSSIEVEVEDGAIVVSVSLVETTTGANITILASQVEYDHQTGRLLIRFNNRALQPSGQFTSTSGATASGIALVWWEILLIVLGGVAAVVIVSSVMLGVIVRVRKRKPRTLRSTDPTLDNTYEQLKQAEKDDVDEVKIPLDESDQI